MSDFEKYVGRRVLVKETTVVRAVKECRIKEVSPSGNHVFLSFPDGDSWEMVAKYEILEVLPEQVVDDKHFDECRKLFTGFADEFIRVNKAFQKAMNESKVGPK